MIKKISLVVLLVIGTCAGLFYCAASADSSSRNSDWLSGTLYLSRVENDGSSYACSPASYEYTFDKDGTAATSSYYGCIIYGTQYDFLVHPYTKTIEKESLVYAARPHASDGIFYKIAGDATNRPVLYYPESGSILVRDGLDYESHTFQLYKEQTGVFAEQTDSLGAVAEYTLEASQQRYVLDYPTTDILLSGDGRYILTKHEKNNQRVLTKIDTNDGTISEGSLGIELGSGEGVHIRAVSRDGRWVYADVLKQYTQVVKRVVIDTLSCNVVIDTCLSRDLAPAYTGGYEYAFTTLTVGSGFNDAANTLVLWSFSGERYVVSLSPVASVRLEYLALGDSFSSGEGDLKRDTETQLKAYREHTDDNGTLSIDGSTDQIRPKEKCHLSTNSYPYHLALAMGLGVPAADNSVTKWQSVACSGATSWDVKEQGSEEYKGQNDDTERPRLEGYDVAALKSTALNEFIPGRQKQIEFVKKYKPKVITLTMGGNDINFGGKMQECVSRLSTCSYAASEWRTNLKNEIYGQFDNLSSLYGELRDATDGQSKIYVIGYPVYINADPDAKCPSKLLFLNLEEREMVVNSILYLNNIIEAAAKNAGVTYVDIEHAFGNHRLCDDDESHVNAVAGILGYGGNELQESFHPNKQGHVDMTNAIWDFVDGISLLDYVTCPGSSQQRATCPNTSINANDAVMPPYFLGGDESDRNTIVRYYTLTSGVLMKSVEYNGVRTGESWFEPESKVDATLYSTPTHLGQFIADQDGNLHADITIPASVPAGYHRLSITGTASDGWPIEVYQTVLVQGLNENDLDEDGVPNDEDRCAYGLPVDDDVNIESDKGCSVKSVGPKVRDFDASTESGSPVSPTAGSLFAADNADSRPLLQATTEPDFSTDIKTRIHQPYTKSTNNTLFIILASIVILSTATLILYSKRRKI